MTRKYDLGKRADLQAETRRRIVAAAVELHGTVGPARTTISAIARHAGVERKTVYRHFPDPDLILEACSGHFRALSPPPDPARWDAIADPFARLHRALTDCYRYYRRHEQLIANVLRDRELGMPAGEGFALHRAAARDALVRAFRPEARRPRRLKAALDVALDFHTWQTLARAGLSDTDAADLSSAFARQALGR